MKKYLALAILALGLGAARADFVMFDADLSGLQSVPAHSTPASGFGTFTLDTLTDLLTFNVNFSGLLAPATAAHIHTAAAGVNGSVTLPFTAADGSWQSLTSGTIVGSRTITPLLASQIESGLTYVNIHTSLFPGGEIRGQIETVPEPASLAMGAIAAGAMGYLIRRRRGTAAD